MNKVPIIRADCFANFPSVVFGMSTRNGGVSPAPLGMNCSLSVGDDEANVKRNREMFCAELNIRADELAIPGQVHSATVRVVRGAGAYPECDALITDARRVFLCVSVADCVPVFLFDRSKNVVAGIHAGWRGTLGKIVEKSVDVCVREFRSDPTDIVVYVGPSAGVCCYEVGSEVAKQFDERFIFRQNGKMLLDLKKANIDQLARAGIVGDAIEVSPACTIHDASLLHSYRRENKKSGRMMAAIGLAM